MIVRVRNVCLFASQEEISIARKPSGLTAAHRGYEYQDLLVACRLVDVLLGSVVQVSVDEKLTVDDRFDDLSTIDVDGGHERIQFKHTENADRPLGIETFTTEARRLRLDFVIASILLTHRPLGYEGKSSLHVTQAQHTSARNV